MTMYHPFPTGQVSSLSNRIQVLMSYQPLVLTFPNLLLLLFSCQVMSNSAIPWTATFQASLSFTISWNLFKFMFVELVMLLSHPVPLSFFCLQSVPRSGSFPMSQLFAPGGQKIS